MTFALVGHRGALGLEPENTLRSFRRAVAEGAHAVELDLRLTSDEHLVILHDADVERTTDGKGPIAAMTLDEVKTLDAGAGEKIPTFAEVLDEIDLPLQAEIKAAEACRPALDMIRGRGLADRITVTSFSAETIQETRSYLPTMKTGLIASHARPELVEKGRSLGVSAVCPGLAELDEEFARTCHAEGFEVYTWPVNDAEGLLRALRAGADAVTTDFPDVLVNATRHVPEVRDLLAGRAPTS
ncbi:glycerophosphodiester phosphodiesterase family protein [Actinopolymorpha sp. B17G11]|uniref:glycerophosphodiester phosphodiesterase n=1 Tax=Actinopolymorpha sp. B17G11 TaxID=3160861 RepID=UPI0032E4DCC2